MTNLRFDVRERFPWSNKRVFFLFLIKRAWKEGRVKSSPTYTSGHGTRVAITEAPSLVEPPRQDEKQSHEDVRFR